jgi:pimeloyl-ACP methyl ester carboxylesterase
VQVDAGGGKRGLIGAFGKKLLKILAFKLVDKAAGLVGDYFVSRWEAEHRPHRLRSFTPQDYRSPAGKALGTDDLANLCTGPALLFIHGTASQGHKAFGALPQHYLTTLHQRYDGRVFAFEHPTLSVKPDENVRWLARQLRQLMPADQELLLDVVAHSRGGLVGRVMCEQAAVVDLDSTCVRIRELVMVATPNAGTPLADRAHLHTFIDTLTNLLEFFPDNPATDALDVLLALLKQVAVGAMGGLEGLMSMDPQGDFLRGFLNRPGSLSATYHALAANFEPTSGAAIGRYARDHLTDLVFALAENDLVVPTEGVYHANGASGFPVSDRFVFQSAAAVDHSGFWTRQPTLAAFDRWLAG